MILSGLDFCQIIKPGVIAMAVSNRISVNDVESVTIYRYISAIIQSTDVVVQSFMEPVYQDMMEPVEYQQPMMANPCENNLVYLIKNNPNRIIDSFTFNQKFVQMAIECDDVQLLNQMLFDNGMETHEDATNDKSAIYNYICDVYGNVRSTDVPKIVLLNKSWSHKYTEKIFDTEILGLPTIELSTSDIVNGPITWRVLTGIFNDRHKTINLLGDHHLPTRLKTFCLDPNAETVCEYFMNTIKNCDKSLQYLFLYEAVFAIANSDKDIMQVSNIYYKYRQHNNRPATENNIWHYNTDIRDDISLEACEDIYYNDWNKSIQQDHTFLDRIMEFSRSQIELLETVLHLPLDTPYFKPDTTAEKVYYKLAFKYTNEQVALRMIIRKILVDFHKMYIDHKMTPNDYFTKLMDIYTIRKMFLKNEIDVIVAFHGNAHAENLNDMLETYFGFSCNNLSDTGYNYVIKVIDINQPYIVANF